MTFNRHDLKQVYEAHFSACVIAVRDGFPHLAIRDIIAPPHEWFDAALARQVVIHLMVRRFEWPKRRVVEVEERSREAVNRALRTVDRRLESPRFAAHYRRMAISARAIITNRSTETEAA